MLPASREPDPGAGHEIRHRSGREDFSRPGQRGDPRADVNRNPVHVVAGHLDLTRVHAGSNLDSQLCTARVIAQAQRTALSGRSNLARKPSPTLLISCPPKRESSRRMSVVVGFQKLLPASTYG